MTFLSGRLDPGRNAVRDGRATSRSRFQTGLITLVAALACATSGTAAPAAAAIEILPLDQIHRGMRGVGRTVFAGDSISEFGVEVVDIIHGARPRGDLILFRGSGEVLEHAGIIAGMSGSPVYIDGKLVGAVAFAYPFVKDPIGGITPIGEMRELDRYPLPDPKDVDGMESGPAGAGGTSPEKGRTGRPSAVSDLPDPASDARASGDAGAFAALWSAFTKGSSSTSQNAVGESLFELESSAARSSSAASAFGSSSGAAAGGLQPLPVPLSFSGWEPGLLEAARGPARAAGFLVATDGGQAGDAASSSDAGVIEGSSATLVPGAALALEMVGGDATLAAIGTVTAVDGNRVYAFGHPMVQGGMVAFPMCGAWIHTVMPNLQNSFKMGSPTRPIGGVWEDRRPGVLGLLGTVPSTIPVRVDISLPGLKDGLYRYRIVRDPFLSPMFLPWVVANSYQHAGWLQGETTAMVEVTVNFDGGRTLRRQDLVVNDAPALGLGGSAVLPAVLLLTNPYQRVRLDSLSVTIHAEPGHAAAEVMHVRCTPRRLAPGDTLRVDVTLQLWRGDEEVRTARFVVPAGWQGKRLRVTAAGTSELMEWDRDRAPGKWNPRDLDDLLRMVETVPSAGGLHLRITSGEPGALVRGRELPTLPGSLLMAGSEAGAAAAIRPVAAAILEERTLDTPWEISGRETAEVEIMR